MDAQSKDRKILIIGESSQLGKDLVSVFIDKMSVLSMAPMLGEAIHRIHSGLSVGAMFDSNELA